MYDSAISGIVIIQLRIHQKPFAEQALPRPTGGTRGTFQLNLGDGTSGQGRDKRKGGKRERGRVPFHTSTYFPTSPV